MQKIIRHIIYVFLWVYGATAALTIITLAYIYGWATPERIALEFPYLGIFVTSVILETVGIIFFYARHGIRYLPRVIVCKSELETIKFFKNFISEASSVVIVSSRGSWIGRDDGLVEKISEKLDSGRKFEIILPKKPEDKKLNMLKNKGLEMIVTNGKYDPNARFTLINSERHGSEMLAISRGVYPDHEITVFSNESGPQIIGMAKDIIKKSRNTDNDVGQSGKN